MKKSNNGRWELWYNRILPYLILLDFILTTVSLILNVSKPTLIHIEHFDLFVCIILLGEFFYYLFKAPSKKKYLLNRDNILLLIASIPFDFIIELFIPVNFPGSILGYLRLLRLIRVISLRKWDQLKTSSKRQSFTKS